MITVLFRGSAKKEAGAYVPILPIGFALRREDAIKIGESIKRWRGIRPTIVYQLPSEGIFVMKERKYTPLSRIVQLEFILL